MRMTWSGAEDFITRRVPFLIKLNAGTAVDDAMRQAVEKPFKVKRVKANGR